MRSSLLAEAKAVLVEAGIETPAPRPGTIYHGWLTFKDAPLCIVVEEKDRPLLTEACQILLAESHKAEFGNR